MKLKRLFFVSLAALALAGCSSLTVSRDEQCTGGGAIGGAVLGGPIGAAVGALGGHLACH